jgi:peptidoglycan/LPS O-acetylase OafA/YrhL
MPVTAIHPAVPVLIIGLLTCAVAAVLVRSTSFYRTLIDKEVSSTRAHSIDGLRGYLALGVVFHHVVINYQYYQSGEWALTPSSLNTFLGRGSVAFFFMTTAYLFWSRALNESGRVDAFRFYVSRLRRMVPMYLVSAGLVVITALALTHLRLLVRPLDLTRQVMSWALFTIPGAPNINTFNQTSLINTVLWSLVYEWKFYFLFPFLAIFARTWLQWGLATVAALYIGLYSDSQIEWFFLAGCVAAMLTHARVARNLATGWIGASTAIVCIAVTIKCQPMVYSWLGASLLFVAFFIFASGNTMFGILTWRPARLLGVLSYSIYLLHNWALYLVSKLVNHYTSVGALSERPYWFLGAFVVLLTLTLAAVTYRFIEYPCLQSRARNAPKASNPKHAVAG